MRLQHPDHVAEIFRLRIARPENVQFLLHKEPCLVGHLLLGIADIDHASRERDLFNRRAKSLRQSDRLNDHVGAAPTGQLGKVRMQVALGCIDGMRSASLARGLELGIIQIDPDDCCAAKYRARNGAQPHAAAPEHRHRIAGRRASTRRCMKAHRQRLHEAQLLQREIGPEKPRRRHRDPLRQGAIALHTERLIELARIRPPAQA